MASRLAKVATQRRRERRAKAASFSVSTESTASAWTAFSDADESRNQTENEKGVCSVGGAATFDDSTISSAAWTLNSKSQSLKSSSNGVNVDAAPPMIILSPSSKRTSTSSNRARFSQEQDAVTVSTASRRRRFARARATTPNPPLDRQDTLKTNNDYLNAKKKLDEVTAKLQLVQHEKQNLQQIVDSNNLSAKDKDQIIDNLEQRLGLAELELGEQKQKTREATSREEDNDQLRSELEQLLQERSANEEYQRTMKSERDKMESDLMECMERLET
ncbi:hypothetical protein THAOC_37871, partial [Thalassiosira oceanica]